MTYTHDMFDDIPHTLTGQEKYIAEGDGNWEKLARLWECEAVQAARKGCDSTPKDVAARRWKAFWEIWDREYGSSETPQPAG